MADANECADRLFASADRKLNIEYSELLNSISPSFKNDLVGVQRSWLMYRDTGCNSSGDDVQLGREAYADKMRCLTNITSRRISEVLFINYRFYSDGFVESKNFYFRRFRKTPDQFLDDLVKFKIKNRNWQAYAVKNCDLVMKISQESSKNCMARMVFQTLRN